MDDGSIIVIALVGVAAGFMIQYLIIKTAIKTALKESGLVRTTAAGWYADPSGNKSIQRYYDGSAWTSQTRPIGQQ